MIDYFWKNRKARKSKDSQKQAKIYQNIILRRVKGVEMFLHACDHQFNSKNFPVQKYRQVDNVTG